MERWIDHKAGHCREEITMSQRTQSQDSRRSVVSSGVSKSKLYVKLVSCYQSEKEKFGGTCEKDWIQVLSENEGHAELFGLNRQQKLSFLSVVFKDDAKTFKEHEVRHFQTWGEAVLVLNEQYNSEARVRKIVDKLKDIRIKDYIPQEHNEGHVLQLVARRKE